MKWLAIAIGAFAVMVYALLNSSLTHEQVLIIVGLAVLCAFGVFMFAASAMTDKLREYREQFAAMTVESEQRIAKLKGLQEQVREAKAEQQP